MFNTPRGIRRGRSSSPDRHRQPGHPLLDARREAFAVAVAAGAALSDAYVMAGYTGDPTNGWPTRLLQQPTVAARFTELVAARTCALLNAVPAPTGIPTRSEWLAELISLARDARLKGAHSAAVAAYAKVWTYLASDAGKSELPVTAEEAATAVLDLLDDPRYGLPFGCALAHRLVESERHWQQLQIAVQAEAAA